MQRLSLLWSVIGIGFACNSPTAATGGTPAPTVAFSANPSAIAVGQSSKLIWLSSNATGCTASGGWSGSKAPSDTLTVTPTTTTTYTLSCTGAGGTTSQSATVTVGTTPAPPSIALGTNPATIASGQLSTLSWSAINAANCTASGGWSGPQNTSGSQNVSPTSTTTYTLTCTGTGGTTSQSATVTVGATPAPPTITFGANPASIASGQTSTLNWSSINATSCTASGGWSGTQSTSGSQSVAPTSTTTYTLTCTGTGGTTSQSATVTVGATSGGLLLKVGPTSRYLVDQNGKPFFLTGDAAWSLIAQLSDQDADTYLTSRQQLGFNVVLANLIEHQFATNAPADIYGNPPFTTTVFTTPNEAYFAHADYIIQSAAQKGIVVLLDPTYVGYQCGSQGWCAEMEAASDADMVAWGQFLGNRYKNYDNIVWVIGGDTDPGPVKTKLQDVVNGIQHFDTRHLFTAHNNQEEMAIDPWPGASWLTVNDTYTYNASYLAAQTAYAVSPAIPFFLIEAQYENEHSMTQPQLRAESYWTVLSGGFGHVFGNCPIWNFGSETTGQFCSSTNWKGQLSGQGSVNMKYLQALFNSRHWYTLVPDAGHTALTAGYGTPGQSDYATAAYASDGSSIIAYLPTLRQVTVSGSTLTGDTSMNGWWYNPATGVATATVPAAFPTSVPQNLTPPSSGDWVLVLDGASFNFPAP